MPYNAQQLHITWGYTINGTVETAFTGLSVSAGVAWDAADDAIAELDAGDMSALASRMIVLMSTSQLKWADYSKLVTVKVAALDIFGDYLVTAGNPKIFDVGTLDQGDQDHIPPQCSVVLSMRTVTTLGPGNYGRMYLPHTRLDYQDGTVTPVSGHTAAIATAAATFVDGVVADVNAGVTDTVAAVIMGKTGTGTTKSITRVGVGSVVDTQRRRRRQLTETYAFADVDAP